MLTSTPTDRRWLMAKGDEVAAIALSQVGTMEVPVGSNTGPMVKQYQAATDLGGTGWPWCAAFVEWCWEKAGGIDTSICDAYTGTFADRARSTGQVGQPRPGAAICWPGKHVELLIAPTNDPNVWHGVGGNVSDGVRRTVRSLAGALIIVPKALLRTPTHSGQYWIEDVYARDNRRVYGPWRGTSGLEHARVIAARARTRGLEARVKRVGPGDRFATLVGPRVLYGPWREKEHRDNALAIVQRRLGRTLRPYSTTVRLGSATAADLGKTT
jgi:hypothetical protein